MGILAATRQIKLKHLLDSYIIMGELSLDGNLQPIRGALSIAIKAKEEGLEVYGVTNISRVIAYFDLATPLTKITIDLQAEFYKHLERPEFDFADVKGQQSIKRCMEIAAAGGHNIILIGPPGSGKTMLAKRLPSILPPMTLQESLETTKIHSVAGRTLQKSGIMTSRPFRSPHHTISDVKTRDVVVTDEV